jgi:uncharacterized MAPEG superfamily protein
MNGIRNHIALPIPYCSPHHVCVGAFGQPDIDNPWFGNGFWKAVANLGMLGVLPWGLSPGDLERFNATKKNSIENEIPFALTALAYASMASSPTDLAKAAIVYFVGFRAIFTASHMFRLQPFRTFAYLGGLATQVYMSYLLMSTVPGVLVKSMSYLKNF